MAGRPTLSTGPGELRAQISETIWAMGSDGRQFRAIARSVAKLEPVPGGDHEIKRVLPATIWPGELGKPGVYADCGRSGGTRTHDPRFWRPMLYQLSYTPAGGSRLYSPCVCLASYEV